MVEAEFLETDNHSLQSPVIYGGSQRSEVVMVGDTLQKDLLAVELEAVGLAEFYRAETEMLADAVQLPRSVAKGDFRGVEPGLLAAPQLRVFDEYRIDVEFNVHQVVAHRGCVACLGNQLSVRVEDFHGCIDRHYAGPVAVHRYLQVDFGLLLGNHRGGYVNAFFGYRDGALHYQVHRPEQAAAGVPARAFCLAGEGLDKYFILCAVFQQRPDVETSADVSVINLSGLLSVDPDVGFHTHSLEIEQYALPLPVLVGDESGAVPACLHTLESSRAAGFLFPRQFHLEIVGYRDAPPGFFGVKPEIPFTDVDDFS